MREGEPMEPIRWTRPLPEMPDPKTLRRWRLTIVLGMSVLTAFTARFSYAFPPPAMAGRPVRSALTVAGMTLSFGILGLLMVQANYFMIRRAILRARDRDWSVEIDSEGMSWSGRRCRWSDITRVDVRRRTDLNRTSLRLSMRDGRFWEDKTFVLDERVVDAETVASHISAWSGTAVTVRSTPGDPTFGRAAFLLSATLAAVLAAGVVCCTAADLIPVNRQWPWLIATSRVSAVPVALTIRPRDILTLATVGAFAIVGTCACFGTIGYMAACAWLGPSAFGPETAPHSTRSIHPPPSTTSPS